MCGFFFASRPLSNQERNRVDYFLQRRGEKATVWSERPNGWIFAHSLLPLRKCNEVPQPIVAEGKLLLYAGELWDADYRTSDTLTLFERLISQGLEPTLKTSIGTWAVLWAHEDNGIIEFATDRVGEQPLHYAEHDKDLYVASEIKYLAALNIPLKLIKPARPGLVYRFDGSVSEFSYYQFQSRESPNALDSERTISTIREAIRSQIECSEPQQIGLLISGGLDSSIVAFHAAEFGITKAWTVALHEDAIDAVAAGKIAVKFDLDWKLVIAQPAHIDEALVRSETFNRSLLEECTLHIPLARSVAQSPTKILFTGTGADELFIGYKHLFRRYPKNEIQMRLVNDLYKLDARAMNKLYGSFCIELRNPFLHPTVLDYASSISAEALIGPDKSLKFPLRSSYSKYLDDISASPKKIARDTMGVRNHFEAKYGTNSRIFHSRWREFFSDFERLATY